MKIKNKFTLGLFFIFSITVFTQASFAGCNVLKSGQAAFFEHSKYRGDCVVRIIGRYANAKAIGIGNDKISSIKLGDGTQVVLCKDNNFKGTCKTYAKSMSSIGRMNDKTSSAIIVRTVPPKSEQKVDLAAPSDLNLSEVTSTTVILSWVDNSDREFGVEVYRMDPIKARHKGGANWKFLGLFEERIGSNARGTGWRSDEDFDLNPNTNYCYRLRAYVGFDRSEVSDYTKIVCTKTSDN